MKTTLQNSSTRGLFIPMNNLVTPDDMERCADSLDEAARALRQAAGVFRGHASIKEIPGAHISVPSYITNPPAVLTTAEKVLREAGKPLHITELLERIRVAGSFVKDQLNLSSMLSKDAKATFRPVAGRRGFWELVR